MAGKTWSSNRLDPDRLWIELQIFFPAFYWLLVTGCWLLGVGFFNFCLDPGYSLFIKFALNPAPNPLSILTTDTPLAQLVSIARSAETP